MSESDIDIVIRCKCGKPLRETARETESIYEEIWCEGDRRD